VRALLRRIRGRAESIAGDVTLQMGKPIAEARREATTAIDRARYMMSVAPDALADVALPPKTGFERFIEKVPLGVVLDIALGTIRC
jgi:acyl-CoA reductase-like NAD-dependent aldehyde dehydrogenase